MKKIKICYVIGTLEIGGAEKQLLKLIQNMDKEKFSHVVIALRGGRLKEEFEKETNVIIAGKKWKIDVFFLFRLISIIRKESPDILHTFMFTSNTWGRISGIIGRVPVIISSERCVDIWKRWYHKWTDRILLKYTYKVVGNSNSVKKFYQKTEKIPENKITVIYNGVDLKEFGNINTRVEIKKEGFWVGAGGRFTEQKGLINLLKAVPEVIKIFPKTKFVLVGDGPLRNTFEKFVKDNGTSGNVMFTGYRKDILSIFSLCDVIVVPSLFEGMPNIVLEAMALKKPVIGTNIPEIAELIIDEKNGFLVPVKDNVKDIAEKILFLWKTPEVKEKMGEAGYNLIKERFSLERMVREYETLYIEALGYK
ncbi:MAG: glycosyltransferase [bacterium]|nr:glycosyltransferase [bacterium]